MAHGQPVELDNEGSRKVYILKPQRTRDQRNDGFESSSKISW